MIPFKDLPKKPTEKWQKAVYPSGYDGPKDGTFEEWDKLQHAYGIDNDYGKVSPPPDPEPPTPPPPPPPPPPPIPHDPNWENMTWEQKLDAMLGGWASGDGVINYDNPLCPFKRPNT